MGNYMFDQRSAAGGVASSMCAAILLGLSTLVASGCERYERLMPDNHAELNAAMVQAMNRSSVDAAIVSQHTLHPYHFVQHSAELNELGRRDLHVLIAHYRTFSGPAGAGEGRPLNVRRGPVSDAMYDARVASVVQAIREIGVDPSRIVIDDAMPGGDGATSDRVIRVLETDRTPPRGAGRTATQGVTR